jgi:hypothetical protein
MCTVQELRLTHEDVACTSAVGRHGCWLATCCHSHPSQPPYAHNLTGKQPHSSKHSNAQHDWQQHWQQAAALILWLCIWLACWGLLLALG